MHIYAFLWIATCCAIIPAAHSVVQYKHRGPPFPPRQPHVPMYPKSKWPMPPRQQSRPFNRPPMQVHMASYKVPVLARPVKAPAPLIFPSTVWKTPTAVYRPPVEKPYVASPPVAQTYEAPVKQQEPTIIVPTIKQVGEKGPIHTIPAPNLSPADKPDVFLQQPVQKHVYQYTKAPENSLNAISNNVFAGSALIGAQALPLVATPSHQYQVTENSEPKDHFVESAYNRQQAYYVPDSDPNSFVQKLTQYTDPMKLYPTDIYMAPQQAGGQLSAQDLYQLLNAVPQQPVLDPYAMPLVQQPQLQQHFVQPTQQQPVAAVNYQSLLSTPQLLQAESAYFNQIPDTISQQIKDNFKPQFHTFNYVEPMPHRKHFAQSRVTADYSLDAEPSADAGKLAVQNAQDALAQTQYVQHYFTTRENNNAGNQENVIDDSVAKDVQDGPARASQILSELSAKNELSPTMFYSSLPNREAAERLASLQAAGSINSSLRKVKQTEAGQHGNQRDQMRIYVPDEETSYEDMETQASGEQAQVGPRVPYQGVRIYETTQQAQDKSDTQASEEHGDYGDYSSEEEASTETKNRDAPVQNAHQNQVTFGDTLQVPGSSTK